MRDLLEPDQQMRCMKYLPTGTKAELDSYLIEITRDILGYKDEDGKPLVDKDSRYGRTERNREVDRG
jgi:6-phosphogluconate dehydrogenase